MTARQMFEELGYKKCNGCIRPVYIKKDDPCTWVNFCTTGVGISTQHGLGYEFLNCKLIKAINQQCKELGWLGEEETCTNESEYNLVDGFECSNCGIIIENYNEIEIDEDYPEDRCMKEYAPRYCPNCGRKIVD